jgi:hypothetical protein
MTQDKTRQGQARQRTTTQARQDKTTTKIKTRRDKTRQDRRTSLPIFTCISHIPGQGSMQNELRARPQRPVEKFVWAIPVNFEIVT